MAVNGIDSRSGIGNGIRSAQFNFNRFTSDVMLDNMDRINDGQRAISQELRDILSNAKRNDEDGINFDLYSKEDEKNPNAKADKDDSIQPHIIIRNPGESIVKAAGRTSSPAECKKCAERRYQDGSDENDVSFKTPTHIAPSIAASVILGHEHEHVANAYEKEYMSNVNGHEHLHAHVDRASVRLKTDICPECGRVYFSGGVTDTQISFTDDEQFNPYDPLDPYNPYKVFEGDDPHGANVDMHY